MATMVQVKLENGTKQLTCWVDTVKRFKAGDRVSLKKQDGLWTVISISEARDASLIHTDWKVGGL